VVFPGVPAEADEASIRLGVEGPQGTKLFGVRFSRSFSPEAVQKRRRELEARIQDLEDEKAALGDQAQARLGEMDILKALGQQQVGSVRSLAEQQLSTAEQSGSRALATAALQNLGRVQMAAGDLAAARRSYQEAMQLSTSLGEDLKATAARLGLAQVALAEANVSPVSSQAGEAVALSRTAAAWYKERRMRDHEARALAVLAEAYLLKGRFDDAVTALNKKISTREKA